METSVILYRGIVTDKMGTLPTRKTRWYENYKQAHLKAELLMDKYGERAVLSVLSKTVKVTVKQ